MKLALLLYILVRLAVATKIPSRDYFERQYFVVELDTRETPELLDNFIRDYNSTFRFEHPARGLDDHYVFSVAKDDPHASFLGNHNSNDYSLMRRAPGLEDEHDRLVLWQGLRLVHMMQPRRLERRMPVPIETDNDTSEECGAKLPRGLNIVDSSQEPFREVSERLGINDPIFTEQWHLINTLSPGNDVNVKDVWYRGVRGRNVTVAVIDDGVDCDSEDLAANFNARGLWDFNDNTELPKPRLFDDYHGTRCAGEIAAVKNEVCGIGVAWEAKVAGIRILSGTITAEDEAAAMVYGLDANDIYSCLWGPTDNGQTVAAPDVLVRKALIKGVQQGRDKKGAVYVFASGNGGRVGDQCNFDGYTNSIYSITVGAIDYQGQHPPYSEACSAVMVVTYSSGGREHIHTTDIHKKCASTHGGTSAAAPLAAGLFALVLSANPALTWRDVQYVCAKAAVPVNEDDGEYQVTGLGEKYLHKYGYGKLDADKLVTVAQEWKNVKPQAWYYSDVLSVDQRVTTEDEDSDVITSTITVSEEELRGMNVERVEHVTVKVNIASNVRGRIGARLVSPKGVVSTLAQFRAVDTLHNGLSDWVFMSVAHLGEDGVGDWRLEVFSGPKNTLHFKDWQLRIFGESVDASKAEEFDYDTDYAAVRRDRLGSSTPESSAVSSTSSAFTESVYSTSATATVSSASTEHAVTSVSSSTSTQVSSATPTSENEEPEETKHYMTDHAGQYFMALTVLGFIVVIVLMKWHKGVGSSRRRRREDFEFDIIPGEDYSDSEADSLDLRTPDQDEREREALFEDLHAETLPDYDDDMFQIGDDDDDSRKAEQYRKGNTHSEEGTSHADDVNAKNLIDAEGSKDARDSKDAKNTSDVADIVEDAKDDAQPNKTSEENTPSAD